MGPGGGGGGGGGGIIITVGRFFIVVHDPEWLKVLDPLDFSIHSYKSISGLTLLAVVYEMNNNYYVLGYPLKTSKS